jgi:F-type H+-transporting ATPase subunit b
MLIDWFTVIAQIVNFLVLVALLKHFLWGRLVQAIDQREQRMEKRLAEAEEKNKGAEQSMAQARARMIEQDRQVEAILEQAKRTAGEKRDEMIRVARDDVRGLETRWHEDLDRERQGFLDDLRRRAAGEILAVVRRALADLACTDIQRCAVQVFLEKLRSFDPVALADLRNGDLVLASALELPPEMQQEIRMALRERLGTDVSLRFELAPAMAWGIELRGNGRRIGWNSEAYIESLEESLKEALEHQAELVAG